MPNLSGRFPISYPGPTAALVPWQDHFSDQAQSIADILNGYQLPLAVADASDRAAKFPSPSAGDRIYRLDLKMEQVYRDGIWKNQPSRPVSAQVQKNVTQPLAAGPTAITWNNSGAQHDTDSFYSTGNNTRLTAPFDGLYRVSFTLYSNSASSIVVTSYPYKNGSSLGYGTAPARNGVSGAAVGVTNTFLVALVAGDYLEIRPVVTSPTGNWDTGGACVFGMEYLGQP